MCITNSDIRIHPGPQPDYKIHEEVERLEAQERGKKLDQGKPRMDLLPMDALLEVAKVLTFGCGKYGPRNWERGIARGRLRAAQMRHDAASEMGQELDPETGLLHVAHKATDALMELALRLRNLDGEDVVPRKGNA